MKVFNSILIVVLFAGMAVINTSCGGEKPDRPAPVLTPEQIQANQAKLQAPAVPNGGVAGGVKHYICPNGHIEGGADAQGTCINCGSTLVHNDAFHNQPTTPQATEPAQNAAGIWHYTCPNGHEGGGGAAGPCSVCGTTLAHNQAYH